MVEKQNDKNTLINKAIDASMKFEELMDKTDFDSWLEGDNPRDLEELEQDPTPFKKFEENIEELKGYCNGMITNETGDKSSEEQPIVDELFNAKFKRIEARICFEKEDRERNYKEALYLLLSALNQLQKPKGDNIVKRLLILIYNDLSICYAGLENSSMSRGYAQEARWIIEKKEDGYKKEYKKFYHELNACKHDNKLNISNCDFVSLRLDELLYIAVYNQAVAERGSHNDSDAEKNFRRIIDDAEKRNKIDTSYRNFNYCSALLNLGDLYIDLGRGKEAIELLDKALKNKSKLDELDENDIRYWNVILMKINALIDQTDYEKAEGLLREKHIFDKGNKPMLNKRHRITSTGFKGLNYYVRCIIDSVRNELKRIDNEKECKLNEAKEFIFENEGIMKKRDPKGSVIKAYRQLSEIYIILKQDEEDEDKISTHDKNIRKYLIKYISEDEFISEDQKDDLDDFIKDSEQMGKWIENCDDLDALESFTDQIITIIKDEPKDCIKESLVKEYSILLKEIKKKIINECEDKGQLSRAEKISKRIDEVLEKKKDIELNINIFPEENGNSRNNLTKETICKRLDINEKEFDTVLFERSKLKNKHLAEVIILRRWNSFSPGLHKESKGSLGGGYLLRIKRDNSDDSDNKEEENIVIDPGYNFLQNFRSEDFCIEDIDTIIVTHSHLDHCADLLPVMDLMYQYNKRYKDTPPKLRKDQRKRINLCLSKGAYSKFSTYIDDPDWNKQLKDVVILENLEEMKCDLFDGLTISAIQTPHMDLGGAKTIGLKIKIGKEEKTLCIGFTSDTPWYQDIRQDFEGCDLLCVHMGGIKYQEIGYNEDRYYLKGETREIDSSEQKDKFENKFSEANHLLFHGTLGIIKHYSSARHIKEYKDKYNNDKPLIIVGEFGEELKYGLRTGICDELPKVVNKKRNEKKVPDIFCLPGDIGLYVGIDKDGRKMVRCNFCEKFVAQKEIETFSYGREDAIQYICKTCDKTLTNIQKQAVIEHRVTRH